MINNKIKLKKKLMGEGGEGEGFRWKIRKEGGK